VNAWWIANSFYLFLTEESILHSVYSRATIMPPDIKVTLQKAMNRC